MKLSLVIPVFNEIRWLPRFLDALRRAPVGACRGIDAVELVIVDDGSTDGTYEYLQENLRSAFFIDQRFEAEARIVRLARNAGKGAAVRRGVMESSGDVVLIQDADLEYSPQDYPLLVNPITDGLADVVFGNRFDGHPRRILYFWHTLMNRLLTLLSNALTNMNFNDMEVGYKCFRGPLIRSLRLVSSRFGIEPELASRVARAKVRVYEVPVQYSGRTYAEGKKINWRDGLAALFHILRFGLVDREPYQASVRQTLSALDRAVDELYEPVLNRCLIEAGFDAAARDREGRKILEVGCGIGSLTGTLLKYGSVVATDIDGSFVRQTRERHGNTQALTTRVWDAAAATPAPAEFAPADAVVAFNILEHLEDDVQALKNWSACLAPNGAVIILVPNFPSLFSRIDAAVGHRRRYSRRTLLAALASAGLRCESLSYANALGILGWILNGLLLRRDSLPSGQVALYRRLKPVLRPLERLLERITGLSLVVVARRIGAAERNTSVERAA